ncbi:MAG TPA: TIGR02466 family protein [Nevskiaceae bacterium]|nr:TIGR02466 family protein [Nevskiaceae bacterium]
MTAIALCFPTLIYHRPLLARGGEPLRRELAGEARQIREFDRAGRQWSKQRYPGGYTSYGSLDRLHQFSSTFDTLRRHLDRHVRAYARAQHWDLKARPLRMSDCWLNIMPRGCAHSFHLHPHAVVSGTYYVVTPRGCSGLTFEDPRLSRQMAAPLRLPDAPPAWGSHLTLPARAGEVILFESWLRHEVPASRIDAERISVSFNYHWD